MPWRMILKPSPSAPILWLTYTGLAGLMLLLAAQASVFRSALCASRRSVIGGRVAQAWIALLVQHASYGSWMSPLFLLVCVLVVFGDRAWPSPEPIVDQSEAQLWPQPV